MNDEDHEAHGAMIHRGLVEARQFAVDRERAALEAEIAQLRARLALALAYVDGRLDGVIDNDRDALIRLRMRLKGGENDA
jgi:hypothetical protein